MTLTISHITIPEKKAEMNTVTIKGHKFNTALTTILAVAPGSSPATMNETPADCTKGAKPYSLE